MSVRIQWPENAFYALLRHQRELEWLLMCKKNTIGGTLSQLDLDSREFEKFFFVRYAKRDSFTNTNSLITVNCTLTMILSSNRSVSMQLLFQTFVKSEFLKIFSEKPESLIIERSCVEIEEEPSSSKEALTYRTCQYCHFTCRSRVSLSQVWKRKTENFRICQILTVCL